MLRSAGLACRSGARRQNRKIAGASDGGDYDVVVVGGGLVGGTVAALLRAQPQLQHLKVALIEPRVPKLDAFEHTWSTDETPPTLRCFAINHASAAVLHQCGVWHSAMRTGRVTPYRDMIVVDDGNTGHLHWEAGEEGSLGHIAENDLLQQLLLRRVLQSDVTLLETGVSDVHFARGQGTNGQPEKNTKTKDSRAHVELSDGSVLRTRLLVAADGANSPVKKALKIGGVQKHYVQKGVVCSLRMAPSDAPKTAFQRFTSTGALGVLPCQRDFSSIVWSTSPAHADELLSLDNDEFLRHFNRAIRGHSDTWSPLPQELQRLVPYLFPPLSLDRYPEAVEVTSPRAAFPLRVLQATHYAESHVALVGDAAHVIHPLAGQGVNLGIGDARRLVHCVNKAVQCGASLGDASFLRANYAEPSEARDAASLLGVDAVKGLFSSTSLDWLRGVGLDVINNFPEVKNRFAQEAMWADAPAELRATAREFL
ncbi:MAG: hypothetical protein MHM6MM_001968 [Cercozoa sp. M6MM]